MSKRKTTKQERQIRIRSVRKDPPDLRKLARAIIELAMAQAEAEAEAQAKQNENSSAGTEHSGDAA